MKLYGSVINRLEEHSLSPDPVVGMGATVYAWSDRYAGTITKVSPSGKTVTITEDTVVWEPFPSGYAKGYEPNPDGRTWVARKRPNGVWKSAGNGVRLGWKSAYRDPSF